MNTASKDRIKQTFSLAYNAAMRFDAQVKSTFSHYKAEKEKAQSNSREYKDEQSAYKKAMEAPTAQARSELKAADKEFGETINGTVIPRLRELLADHVTATPPADFMNALRIYKEFNLKPTKMELQTLLHATQGNFMAMRALQDVARGAGFDIKFSDVTAYERDISELEKLGRTPTCYGPLEYSKEVDEIFPEVPQFRPDGTYYFVQASPLRSILNAQAFTAGYKHIQEAQERWTTNIIPEISAYQPVEDEETGETITPYEQRQADIDKAAKVADVGNDPTMLAHKIGQRRVDAAKEAERVLEHYVKQPRNGGDS